MEFGIVLKNVRTQEEKYFEGYPRISLSSFKEAFEVEDLEDLILVDVQASSAFNQLQGRSLEDLEEIASQLSDIDDWQEMYKLLDDQSELLVSEWKPFDEEHFKMFFSDPWKAAKAVFFGNVRSWSDNYFRLNGYENVETTDEPDYKLESEEIFRRWLDEKI